MSLVGLGGKRQIEPSNLIKIQNNRPKKPCSFPVILVSWRNSWLKIFPILNSENSIYLDKLPGRKNSKFLQGWSCLYSISPSNLTRTIFSLLQSIDFSSPDVTFVDSKTTVRFSDLSFGAHEMNWFSPIIWSEI